MAAGLPSYMRAVLCDQPGDADVLRIGEIATPVPGPGELIVRVRATAVNRADVLQRRGFYPPPPGASSILGLELAGEVVAHGGGVTAPPIGARVGAIVAGGAYAEYAVVPAGSAMILPAAMSFETAAAFPEAWITAYDNLFHWGRLVAGERVLIHGGGSGVGSAALQLAAWRGAQPIVTVGSDDKAERCRALGAALAVNYKQGNWADAVGKVDVILDIIGAAYFEANLAALSPGGRLVVIGLQGGVAASLNLMQLLSRRLTVCGSTLRARSVLEKARLSETVAQAVLPAIERGELTIPVHEVVPLAEVARAHRSLEASEHFGKIVLRVP